ncbi:MAG: CpaF family protein [Elusimicrobia bacterium]|nr:CpaF family protein [Elusimicrobiota bacterium]
MHKNVVSAMETERIRISEDPNQNEENRTKVSAIIENLLQRESSLALSRVQREQFTTELVDEILGLGPLQSLLRDSTVNEIMVNAFDKIYIEQRGKLVLLNMRFRDNEQVVQVIKRIVAPVGRRIDESVPLVDARLKDGSRVNAIIAPLAVSGPTLTIRRFSAKPFTDKQLISFGACTEQMIEFIKNCVIVRKNMIISGGTGTGKTTFLNMCSGFIPEDERIITVEDTAELNLMQEHWIRLESRPPNIEGKGEVTIRDLIKNCLRMRPDRIVVGECRGAEALDMLQAMNTGHEGSLATIHANTPKDALSRLSAMCLMAGTDLPITVLVDMISSAVHMVLQLTRFSDGKRRVTYVTEIHGKDGVSFKIQDIFLFNLQTVTPEGKTVGEFGPCGNVPTFYPEFKHKGIEMPLTLFQTAEQKAKGIVPKAPEFHGGTAH